MPTISSHNQSLVNEFRANAGKVGGFFEGRTLLLLHTVGAKSKEERISPTAYVKDGERYIVIASNGGRDHHPNWYHNLLANPLVTIEVGTETLQARAAVAEEPERTRLYEKMIEMMPGFAEYRLKTQRMIPVIVLTLVK
jgi:deazaflavin-dependent oxidoreductase (nitroreductase family)